MRVIGGILVLFNVYKWHSSYIRHEIIRQGGLIIANSQVSRKKAGGGRQFTKRYGRQQRRYGRRETFTPLSPPQDNITVVNFIITILYLFKSCSFSINDEISHAMLEGQVDFRTLEIRKHLYIIHLSDSYLPYYE